MTSAPGRGGNEAMQSRCYERLGYGQSTPDPLQTSPDDIDDIFIMHSGGLGTSGPGHHGDLWQLPCGGADVLLKRSVSSF